MTKSGLDLFELCKCLLTIHSGLRSNVNSIVASEFSSVQRRESERNKSVYSSRQLLPKNSRFSTKKSHHIESEISFISFSLRRATYNLS